MTSRIGFQGEKHPPSDAVSGKVGKDGFYLAKKGKTVRIVSHLSTLNFPSIYHVTLLLPSNFKH